MINITFSDSLSGCLKAAESYSGQYGSEARDLGENIIPLFLNLSLGDISEREFAEKRKSDFVKMFGAKNCAFMSKWFDNEIKKIEKIKRMLRDGHKIRIWYSERSDEFCGFCWLLSVLELWGTENSRILFVKLPGSILFEDGRYRTFAGSGMFEPELLAQLVKNQRYLTDPFKKFHIYQWKRAQQENSKMRISLNGQIISVGEDFFDSIILSEAEKTGGKFSKAAVTGNVLEKTSGIGFLYIVEDRQYDKQRIDRRRRRSIMNYALRIMN